MTIAPEGHPEQEVMLWDGNDLETGRALFDSTTQHVAGYERFATNVYFGLEGDGGLLGERQLPGDTI